MSSTMLTKRRAVDHCRVRSALCRMSQTVPPLSSPVRPVVAGPCSVGGRRTGSAPACPAPPSHRLRRDMTTTATPAQRPTRPEGHRPARPAVRRRPDRRRPGRRAAARATPGRRRAARRAGGAVRRRRGARGAAHAVRLAVPHARPPAPGAADRVEAPDAAALRPGRRPRLRARRAARLRGRRRPSSARSRSASRSSPPCSTPSSRFCLGCEVYLLVRRFIAPTRLRHRRPPSPTTRKEHQP